ncbi:hypothetical protein VB149_03680 [Xanthomonas fragariae]|nr:hypothetical protein [Xanthomonas fragariae]MEA5172996.1 hypothetical protein [Xanthomonas fragariae]MEA5185649.1 hypothetical protein [Xanthomonas fragariae]MEA5197670.1 hypothetical protein [Xanthomonas fragariae]MEA5248744.1 hypothetical protein [Xanthomonas fragariae]
MTGCASSQAKNFEDSTMSAPTIWQLIENLTHQMPLTPEKVAATIGTPLQPHKQTPQLTQYVGAGVPLAGNVRIENSSLALGPQGEFDDKSGLSLELGGACVTLDQVREHYGGLKVTQTPRGRSDKETTVHVSRQPQGSLSFAFRAGNPDCLYRVGIRPPQS